MGTVKTTLTLMCTHFLINLLYLTNYQITVDSVGKGTHIYIYAFVCDQVKMLFTISEPFWKISLKPSWSIFISTAALLSPDLSHWGSENAYSTGEFIKNRLVVLSTKLIIF